MKKATDPILNLDQKSYLAKLIATENITVQANNVRTASFDVENRILTLPIFKTTSKDVTDMLIAHECAHALWTPQKSWKSLANDDELRAYVNVLEDCRIDKKIQKKYPGVVRNYLNGFEVLNNKNFFGLKDKDLDNGLMLIDKINVYYKSSKKLPINFSTLDKSWLKQVDDLKSFKDVLELAKKLLNWQKKLNEKHAKLPDFDTHEITKSYLQLDKNSDKEESENQGEGDSDSKSDFDKAIEESKQAEGKDDKNDEFAVSDKSGEDKEDKNADQQGNGTAVGSGENGQLSCKVITDQYFDMKKDEIIETKRGYRYATLPEPIFKDIIVSNKEFIADMKKSFANEPHVARNYMPHLKTTYKKFVNDSKKTIMYLVKEFEMKKAATAYKRASTDKTGIIDPLKLKNYKFSEDIFKRMTILPDAKNHGMMMLLDWSGSMSDSIQKTVEQLIQLVYFCDKVNIPYEVYFFTSEMAKGRNGTKDFRNNYKTSSQWKYKNDDVCLDVMKLVNVASHKLKRLQLDESLMYLWHLAKSFGSWNMRMMDTDYIEKVSPPHEYYLGSTPLNEALVACLKIVPLFKAKYNIEKMNFITLTDGGANHGLSYNVKMKDGKLDVDSESSSYDKKLVLKIGKKNYTGSDRQYFSSESTTALLLNVLKDQHKITNIGFYLVKRTGRWYVDRYFRDDSIKDYWKREKAYSDKKKAFSKEKSVVVNKSGYQKYFIVNAKDMKVENNDLSGVNGDMKPGKIKQLFNKSMKGRITSRVLLNKFIEMVA